MTTPKQGRRRGVIGYSRDLALIHESGFGSLARAAARLAIRELRHPGTRDGLVIDVGCGGGTLDTALVDSGYQVLGIDISSAMVRLARENEPRARYRVGSWTDSALPPAVGVLAIGECLNYRFGGRVREAQVEGFIRRAHASLAPGGILLFDILGPAPEPENREAWREDPEGGWAVHVRVRENVASATVTRRITSFRRVGRAYRRTVEVHTQVRMNPVTIETALSHTGFRVETLAAYGRERFRPGQIGFLARKPR